MQGYDVIDFESEQQHEGRTKISVTNSAFIPVSVLLIFGSSIK
jgi:hypothetical protein